MTAHCQAGNAGGVAEDLMGTANTHGEAREEKTEEERREELSRNAIGLD